jgi:methionyl-tRNA formyltransferase
LVEPVWRIVFFGTPSFAVPSLKALADGPDKVIAVITQPDKEKGRGRKILPSPVKEAALQQGFPLLQPEKVKEKTFQQELQELLPDLFVTVAYGQILPKSILDIPKCGAVNTHASLLPKYRGAAPIPWAILMGEKMTGVTTMTMDEGTDTGDILLQKVIPIGEDDTSETLHEKLASLGARLLLETIEKMKAGDLIPTPQDPSKTSYAPSLKKENGRIGWSRDAEQIDRQVRAFNPWPGAFTLWEERLLKICRGKVREGTSKGKPGVVVWTGADFIEVDTGKGSFLITELQMEGKRRMEVRDFLSGHPIPVGTVFQ